MEMIQVYNNEIIEQHQIARKGFLSTLALLSKKDYSGNDYNLPDSAKALDIDAYEKFLTGQADKTIDAAIGIANYSNEKLSYQRMLLVELRMGYEGSGKNSKSSDMKRKEIHTRDILSGSNLDSRCYFIFEKDVAPLRLRIHNREKEINREISNWRIVSPEQFNNEFFETPPSYEIKTPVDSILQDVDKKIKEQKYHEILSMIKYWQNKEEYYYRRHYLLESNAIHEMISQAIKLIKPFIDNNQPEQDQFEFILREEFHDNMENLLNHN